VRSFGSLLGLGLSFSQCVAHTCCYAMEEMDCANLTPAVRNQSETVCLVQGTSMQCACCSPLSRAVVNYHTRFSNIAKLLVGAYCKFFSMSTKEEAPGMDAA
jgi:hypothetical protein